MRRSLLTPQLQAKLVAAIADGSTLVRAAKSAGISERTLFRWLGAFWQFGQAVRNAQTKAVTAEITEAMRTTAKERLSNAKGILRNHQGVREGFVSGAPWQETALKLGISRVTEWRYRDHMRIAANGARYRLVAEADRQLGIANEVISAYANGFRAEGIEQHDWAVILGLETGRRWATTGKRTGRRDTKRSLIEAQP